MKDLNDVHTAFQLLDLIQGHPGYQVECYQCGEPLTDLLGRIPPNVGWQQQGFDPGPKHFDSAFGETCPIYWARQNSEDRIRETL